ncbi:hypothetical protein [Thermococcus barophilus]|uniref:Uncharacterized protein n=1 Tax=Thermococcus barophilus TaxID=55802 RepID=A0A0S1X8R9_THEBA|nr:hypothetical protein [Thermococcus barophilus]ALM74152.1 membrane hypothetical protein [Thermococcus barophilus]
MNITLLKILMRLLALLLLGIGAYYGVQIIVGIEFSSEVIGFVQLILFLSILITLISFIDLRIIVLKVFASVVLGFVAFYFYFLGFKPLIHALTRGIPLRTPELTFLVVFVFATGNMLLLWFGAKDSEDEN